MIFKLIALAFFVASTVANVVGLVKSNDKCYAVGHALIAAGWAFVFLGWIFGI